MAATLPIAEATSIEPSGWEFDLGDTVTLLWNGEAGKIIGRTEYVHRDLQYLVEYVNSVGVLVSQWLYEDAIDHQPARH